MTLLKKRLVCLFLTFGVAAISTTAASKEAGAITGPVKIVVPFSAGALIDIIARIYADKLSARIGQPVIVENKPGAGGMVGTQRVVTEPPEKNTMLFVSSSYAVIPSVTDPMPYDTLKDLSGITLIASSPTLLVVNSQNPISSLPEFVATAKKPASHMNYGSAGVNSATDLVGKYFNQEAKTALEHIPYKGVQEGVTEVAAGRISASFPPIALALPYIESGKIKAIAVTSLKRSELLPDTPTVAEGGIPNFDYSIWYGVVMSSKTAQSVKEKLARELSEINKDPDVQKQLIRQGLVPETKVLGEFDQYIAKEITKFGKIIKSDSKS